MNITMTSVFFPIDDQSKIFAFIYNNRILYGNKRKPCLLKLTRKVGPNNIHNCYAGHPTDNLKAK